MAFRQEPCVVQLSLSMPRAPRNPTTGIWEGIACSWRWPCTRSALVAAARAAAPTGRPRGGRGAERDTPLSSCMPTKMKRTDSSVPAAQSIVTFSPEERNGCSTSKIVPFPGQAAPWPHAGGGCGRAGCAHPEESGGCTTLHKSQSWKLKTQGTHPPPPGRAPVAARGRGARRVRCGRCVLRLSPRLPLIIMLKHRQGSAASSALGSRKISVQGPKPASARREAGDMRCRKGPRASATRQMRRDLAARCPATGGIEPWKRLRISPR